MSDVTAAYYDPKGLNIGEIFRYVLSNKGSLHGYSGAKKIPSDELLNLDVDLLIPAALGDVITQANAATVKAKIIIEAANGPISPEADSYLEKAGVLIVPDILANAGGVTRELF